MERKIQNVSQILAVLIVAILVLMVQLLATHIEVTEMRRLDRAQEDHRARQFGGLDSKVEGLAEEAAGNREAIRDLTDRMRAEEDKPR
jgi:uncharacterized membrane-anchored protein